MQDALQSEERDEAKIEANVFANEEASRLDRERAEEQDTDDLISNLDEARNRATAEALANMAAADRQARREEIDNAAGQNFGATNSD